MDDDFELVPKSLVKELKEENTKLKEELREIKEELHEHKESPTRKKKTEREFRERDNILSYLKEIKELNQNAIDALHTSAVTNKTQGEQLLSELAEMHKELNVTLKELKGLHEQNLEFPDAQKIVMKLDSGNTSIRNMEAKLREIEDFMAKLKVLLSQVKPQNMQY